MSAAGARPALDTGTKLAVERTRLAQERTLMAWTRTATALISFGFTIYKFFQFELPEQRIRQAIIGPRGFGLIMMSIGLAARVLSTVEHRIRMRDMRAEYGDIPYSTASIVAGLVSLMGVTALLVVALRG